MIVDMNELPGGCGSRKCESRKIVKMAKPDPFPQQQRSPRHDVVHSLAAITYRSSNAWSIAESGHLEQLVGPEITIDS